jgi:hypothetical protein
MTKTTTMTMTRTAIIKPRWSRSSAAGVAMCVLNVLVQPLAAVSPPGATNSVTTKLIATNKDKPQKEKPYALIFGTAYGPDDRPLYGVKITIRRQEKKHPNWALISDHRGEFAQRVPPGPGDYTIHGEAEYAPTGEDGEPQLSRKMKLKGEARVHVDNEERRDISVHLTE